MITNIEYQNHFYIISTFSFKHKQFINCGWIEIVSLNNAKA